MTLFEIDGDGAGRPASRTAATAWTVTELQVAATAAVENAFPDRLWVEGQIRDLARPRNGHVYFTLVDSADNGATVNASLPVTLLRWHRDAVNDQLRRAGSRVRMDDGVHVRIRGEVGVYAQRSQIQLKMTAIDPAFTLGDLALRRAELLAALDDEGLLNAQKQLVMHPVPLRVALLTSRSSAAEADFCHELDQSRLAFVVERFDTRVQGIDAAPSLCGHLARLDPLRHDVVVIVRGGGAQTDLAAFDDPDVARAVARHPLPIVVGIGHEIDQTVADAVAHASVKTPTAAAAHIVECVRTSQADLERLVGDAVRSTARRLEATRRSLDTVASRAAVRGTQRLEDLERSLDRTSSRLKRASVMRLAAAESATADASRSIVASADQVVAAAERLIADTTIRVDMAHPRRLLQRGWTMTTRSDGTPLHAAGLAPGDHLVTIHRSGKIHSIIDRSEAHATHRDEGGPRP